MPVPLPPGGFNPATKPVAPRPVTSTPPPGPLPSFPNRAGTGNLPLPVGRAVLSDTVRQELSLVGWKDGDPIPPDLGEQLQRLQQAALSEHEQFDISQHPDVVGRKPRINMVKISELPIEQQQQVAVALQTYKQEQLVATQVAAAERAADASIGPHIQGEQREIMRDQILHSDAAYQQSLASQQAAVIIDDRPKSTTEQSATTAAVQPLPNGISDVPTSGVTASPVHCPRCRWPVNNAFEVVPSEIDKQTFIAAIITNGRFTKTYSLLGGKIQLELQSLTAEDVAIIQDHLTLQVRAGRIAGNDEYILHMHECRLLYSVKTVRTANQLLYSYIQPAPQTAGQQTAITTLREQFDANVKAEPLRRIIGTTHSQFQRLVELLETMVGDPDFWNGIEPRV